MNKSPNSVNPGSVFRVGSHVIGCGDSRDKEFVSKVVGTLKVKAVISDPPYGVAVTESKEGFQALLKNKVIANDHLQTDEEYMKFTEGWVEAIRPHLERKNVFYVFNCDKMVFALRDGFVKAGGKFAQLLIWVKTHAVIGRLDYAPQHELILYGWIGTHEFLKGKDKSVIVYPKPNRSPLHPTTKPVGLVRHLVLNSTRIGDVVYDAFLGSGTCAVACEETRRVCVGIELDPEYVALAISRLEEILKAKAQQII